jgi:hypothetical protein
MYNYNNCDDNDSKEEVTLLKIFDFDRSLISPCGYSIKEVCCNYSCTDGELIYLTRSQILIVF